MKLGRKSPANSRLYASFTTEATLSSYTVTDINGSVQTPDPLGTRSRKMRNYAAREAVTEEGKKRQYPQNRSQKNKRRVRLFEEIEATGKWSRSD